MKIEDIRIAVIKSDPGDNPITPRIPRFYRRDTSYSAIIRVITDEGIEGYGSLGMWPRADKGYSKHGLYSLCSQVLGRIKPELVGRDAADREWLWNQRYVYEWWGGLAHQPTASIDIALWDIAGKAAGVPVYKLLGAAREKVLAYASGPYFPEAEEHAELAVECKKMGYRAFKIKPGGGPVSRVKGIASKVREAVGDDMDLMLDAQLCFSASEALELGRHLQALGFKWFEDPVRHNDYMALDLLCSRLDIPIAYTDHPSVRFHELAEMVRLKNGPRILRSDTAKDGITGLKKLCSLAEGFGLKCEIHMGGWAELQVMLSINNCDYYEDLLGWLKRDVWLNRGAKLERPLGPLAIDDEGYVHAPITPGVGGRVYDWSKLNVVEELS